MRMVVIRCKPCDNTFYIFSHVGFVTNDAMDGAFVCPVCKGMEVHTLQKPRDVDPPEIKIREGGKTVLTANLAKPAKQRRDIQAEQQLSSPGLRNDNLGEGPPQEQEEPVIDGVVVPRARSPTLPKYEEECSRYLGVPVEFPL